MDKDIQTLEDIEVYSDTEQIKEDSIMPKKGLGTKEYQENLSTMMHTGINGLYYYYLEPSLYKSIENGVEYDNTLILGTTDAICNIALVPFLNISTLQLTRSCFDTARFGEVVLNKDVEEKKQKYNRPYVFRMDGGNMPSRMDLINCKLYNVTKPSGFPVKRNSNYESKLQEFPYRKIIFSSNIFEEVEVIPYLCRNNSSFRTTGKIILQAHTPINPGGNFYVAIKDGYNGDINGILERNYSNSSMDLPNTSSAYSNYMSTQKAQANNAMWTSIVQGGMQILGGGAIDGFKENGIKGAIAGGIDGIFDGGFAIGKAITSHNAMIKDIKTTPNSLKSTGGDITVRMSCNNQISGQPNYGTVVTVGERIIDDYAKERIGLFFHMYGYAQNKLMPINIRNRHFYNYIKTIGCNVKGKGVPKKYLASIKSIMDKGTTFWHVDRNHVTIGDYQYDNTEV